ncbi:MAG: Mur ligase domain-containing protein, partial [Puniceicoccales bacterium]|nr:Mur ligase domain-containing protein [Puniceicoccales bacterium]
MCKQFLFLGMGGMGMAPLACYVRQQGHVVYGFDDALSPKLEQFFEAQKIIICEQFPEKLDAVIFSTAFPWEHPWMRMARKRNLLPIGRGHFLAKLCERKKMIAITGSHGKTTTTAMLIDHLGDCDYILGGFFAAPNKLPAFYCERNSYLLCEVDESDRTIEAFRPHITVAINLEDDHIGAYGQSENLDAAFGKLFSQTHRAVVIPENNERLKRIAQSVGISPILAPISQQKKDHLSWGENEAVVKKTLTLLKGEKNPPSILFPTEYTPIFRRNQFLGNVEVRGKGMEIWADYAHHPTEIDHCIEKFQWKHGSEKVLFVFQPHRYSRTLQYAHDFAKVFEGKEVVFLPVYGAGESPLDGGTTESIGSHLSSSGGVKSIESLEYFDPTVFYEKDNMPHKILFIGAGDIFQGAQRWVARQHIASFREFLAQHSISFEENFSLKYRQSFQIDATAPLWIEP